MYEKKDVYKRKTKKKSEENYLQKGGEVEDLEARLSHKGLEFLLLGNSALQDLSRNIDLVRNRRRQRGHSRDIKVLLGCLLRFANSHAQQSNALFTRLGLCRGI